MSHLRIFFVAPLILCFAVAETSAQEPTAPRDSYDRARGALERALTVHRLPDRSPAPSFTVEARGVVHARLQSPSPEPPFHTQRLEERIWVHLESDRLAHRQRLEYPDFTFRQRVYVDGEAGARLTPWSDGAVALTEDALETYRDQYRRIPALVLEEARRRASSLRWLGIEQIDGHDLEVISFAEADGDLLTLYVNAATGTLDRIEYLYSDPVEGDAVSTLVFTDYTEADGVPFPTRTIVRRAGIVVEELEPRLVSIGEGPPEDWPADMPAVRPDDEEALADTAVELGEDVYLLQGVAGPDYNVLAVGFYDYVLVVETPLSTEASADIIARIRRIFPERPIRYAVPTHHHIDHAGGARAFIAAGATIVTSPGNRAFFHRMANTERTLEPDALSRSSSPVKIEVLDGDRRVFRDASQVVEIHDVGPNPHAEEHLIAYLPREKLVFQGDLVVFPERGEIEPARPQGLLFARRLNQLGLEVERIAGVHGRVGTIIELQQAVAAARDEGDGL